MIKSFIALILLITCSFCFSQELDKSYRTREIDPEIVAEALKEVESLMGMKYSGPIPKVWQLTAQQVADVVCMGISENCRVGGFTSPGDAIYLHDGYSDVVKNKMHYSILIHELVHQMQYQKYGIDYVDSCYGHVALELEAYMIQNAWLIKNQVQLRVHPPAMECPAVTRN